MSLQMVNSYMFDWRLLYQTIWRREAWRQLRGSYVLKGPVKHEPETLYPNILAELEASGWYLQTLACNAGVSQEIMWYVLEDGEKLTARERFDLAGLLGCKMDYISAPALQIVSMESDRGKWRRVQLAQALQRILPVPGEDCYTVGERRLAAEVFHTMERGEPVTYAAWRWAMQRCADVMQEQRRSAYRPRAARLA